VIVKSIGHHKKHSASYLIKYVFDKRKPLIDHQGNPLFFKTHLRGYDTDNWIDSFNELELQRKSKYGNRSITCYHEVVSFSPESTPFLDRRIIKDLVQYYISLRMDNQLVCGAIHFEKNKNYHAHLISSGIKRDGYSARISKSKFESIKKELQRYQVEKYPELSHSIVAHGLKKKDSSKLIRKKKLN